MRRNEKKWKKWEEERKEKRREWDKERKKKKEKLWRNTFERKSNGIERIIGKKKKRKNKENERKIKEYTIITSGVKSEKWWF